MHLTKGLFSGHAVRDAIDQYGSLLWDRVARRVHSKQSLNHRIASRRVRLLQVDLKTKWHPLKKKRPTQTAFSEITEEDIDLPYKQILVRENAMEAKRYDKEI